MENQRKIIPMGHSYGVTVDIEGVSVLANFEVTEIVHDGNPYPMLLGIDWTIDMNGVINLKKKKMSSEKKLPRVVVPLDLAEGVCYTEPLCNYVECDDDLDHIYKITL